MGRNAAFRRPGTRDRILQSWYARSRPARTNVLLFAGVGVAVVALIGAATSRDGSRPSSLANATRPHLTGGGIPFAPSTSVDLRAAGGPVAPTPVPEPTTTTTSAVAVVPTVVPPVTQTTTTAPAPRSTTTVPAPADTGPDPGPNPGPNPGVVYTEVPVDPFPTTVAPVPTTRLTAPTATPPPPTDPTTPPTSSTTPTTAAPLLPLPSLPPLLPAL